MYFCTQEFDNVMYTQFHAAGQPCHYAFFMLFVHEDILITCHIVLFISSVNSLPEAFLVPTCHVKALQTSQVRHDTSYLDWVYQWQKIQTLTVQ